MKRIIAMLLAVVMVFALCACSNGGDNGGTDAKDDGKVSLDFVTGGEQGTYFAFGTVLAQQVSDKTSTSVTALSSNGSQANVEDIASGNAQLGFVQSDVMSYAYNGEKLFTEKVTDFSVVAALYMEQVQIVTLNPDIKTVADLKGKTVVAAGKGSTPEYALRYLLSENGIDPDADVTLDWKSEHSECVASLASGAATIAMLPQPFVTVAQTQLPDLRVALDLTEEWDALDNGSALLTGVVVARADFVKEHPAAVSNFLEQYSASVDWVNANTAEAAELIGGYDIVDATVAEKALPYCNIVCITGAELLEKLPGYLSVLYNADPAAVGGAMPDNSFYFA